jgi:hypothetical protein
MSRRTTASAPPSSSLLAPAARQTLQRRCACGASASRSECAECGRKKDATLQRKPQPGAASEGEVPAVVHEVLRQPGRPLDATVRQAMEARFRQDFSDVRVHADAQAAASARAVAAAAYTVGRDVVFGPQQYAPSTASGQRLLAHELAHVVQQAGAAPSADGLKIGAADSAHEAQADRAAEHAMRGGSAAGGSQDAHGHTLPHATTASGASGPASAGAVLQRDPLPGMPALNLPTYSIDIEGSEAISTENPKLVELAARAKADASARVEISASLTEAAKNDSAAEAAERSRLVGRMAQTRDALQALGVPRDRVDLRPPTAYATSAKGQVSVSLRKSAAPSLPPFGLPGGGGKGPVPGGPQPPQPAPASGLPNLSDLLTLKFGPITVELPKSVKAKLPIALSAAKSLVIELQGDAPAKFSFKITLDGTPHVRVSASAGVEYDTDKKVTRGSAGLAIESVKTVCHAVNPEETRIKIKAAGDKLMKAGQEYSAAADAETKQNKLIDIAGAVGEMYDAVDKAKAACKEVPRWKLEFGLKGRIGGSGPETSPGFDPNAPPDPMLGGTLTIPF